MEKLKRREGWQDVVALVIAVWLVVSPFVLNFTEIKSASFTTMTIGLVSLLVTQLGIAKQQPWEERFNLGLAALLMLSPFFLGYFPTTNATLNAVISGLLLAGLAVSAMVLEHSEQRRLQPPTQET